MIVTTSFSKSSDRSQNVLSPHKNEKPAYSNSSGLDERVLEGFGDGLAWTVGQTAISFPEPSFPLTSGRKTRDSGRNHFEITTEITEFRPSGFSAQSASVAHA